MAHQLHSAERRVPRRPDQEDFSRTTQELLLTPLSWLFTGLIRLSNRLDEEQITRLARAIMAAHRGHLRRARAANVRCVFGPQCWDEYRFRRFDREHLDYVADTVSQIIQLGQWSPAALRGAVVLRGESYLQDALRLGKGVLLISDHLDFWYARIVLPSFGYPFTTVTNRIPVRSIEAYVRRIRRRFNVSSTYVGAGGAAATARAFQENRIVSLSYDICVPSRHARGAWLPFGPALIYADLGPAKLALAHHVPVLRVSTRSLDGQRWLVSVTPEASAISSTGSTLDPAALQCRWLQSLYGDLVRQPTRWWLWSHAQLTAHRRGRPLRARPSPQGRAFKGHDDL